VLEGTTLRCLLHQPVRPSYRLAASRRVAGTQLIQCSSCGSCKARSVLRCIGGARPLPRARITTIRGAGRVAIPVQRPLLQSASAAIGDTFFIVYG